MKKALLLIDVQKYYVTERHLYSLSYIKNMIGAYSQKGLPIFCVTFGDPLGKSIVKDIKQKLDKAKGVWHFSKSNENGAREIKTAMSLRGLEAKEVRVDVCGFYTDICVLKTVSSLKKYGYKIVVHYDGTGSSSELTQASSIKKMKKMGIVIR
jgi:nicotinamidase-related amidase